VTKEEKFKMQEEVDSELLDNIKGVKNLKRYLGARFSLTNRSRPHLMSF
jgi:hypothetical protein